MYPRIYFDTTPLVYFFDRTDEFYVKVRDFIFESCHRDSQFYTSVLTDMEYLTFPYKVDDFQKINNYHGFMKYFDFKKINITQEICWKAAQLRSGYGFLKQMDALHLASCDFYHCDVFLTNDKQLAQITEVPVTLVGDL